MASEWLDLSLTAKLNFVQQGGTDKWVLADIASIYAIKGDLNKCVEWMEKAVHSGWCDEHYASRDPYFETVEGNNEFQGLMTSVRQKIENMKLNLRLEDEVILN